MARVTKKGGKLFARTFASGTWGDGDGEAIGENYWLCDSGPLAGKGPSRFTGRADVKRLIQQFSLDSIEELSRTELGGQKRVSELLILGTK
jgi:hypothetical protein